MFQTTSKQKYPVKPDLLSSKRNPVILLLGCFLLFFNPVFVQAADEVDSLLVLLNQEDSTPIRAGIMLKIAREYAYLDLSKSRDYANQAFSLFKAEKDTLGMAKSLTVLGGDYLAQGDYPAAERNFNEALVLARKQNDQLQAAKILHNLASIKMNTGQIDEAINYFLEAGEWFEKTKYTDGAIAVENSISVLYQKVGSYEKAHLHLQKAVAMAETIKDFRMLGTLYYNLGNLLNEEEKYEEALEPALNSYRMREQVGNYAGQIKSLMILGSIHYQLNQLKASDTCYQRALQLAERYKMAADEAYILMHYGYMNLEAENYNKAASYLTKSLSLANELEDPVLQLQLYDYLFKADSARGDFRQALAHLQHYNKLKLSWEGNEALERLDELEGLFALAKSENVEKDQIIQRNRTHIRYLWAGILLLLLLTLLVIQQVLLRSQKKIAELSQENLRSQMNPHFIFNILNSIHAFLLRNDTRSSGNYLQLFSGFLRRTLDNAGSKLSTVHDELEALRMYLELEAIRFDKRLEYEIIVDDEIDPLMFRIPTFLLQPYVENSIIHGLQNKEGKGKVEIRLEYRNRNIHCSICDNGIGRKKAGELKKNCVSMHKSKGTAITENRIKLLNRIYGRKFSVMYSDVLDENKECNGTKVEFNLPVLN
ncbi:MAG: tetratricopeptide repeat protein [Bacteroidales bacterium]|nr:tetratricopeptide repeat protein [Bacteroidales bacterium]